MKNLELEELINNLYIVVKDLYSSYRLIIINDSSDEIIKELNLIVEKI